MAALNELQRTVIIDVVRSFCLIAIFFTFSISLTFYNKWILSTENLKFPLSITVTHLVIKFFLSWIIRRAWILVSHTPRPMLEWKTYIKRVTLTGVTSSLDIGLSNWSLLYISVALYTMSKSTATIFVLLFAIIFKLEKFRLITVAVVGLIVGGLFMFTYKFTAFDWEGFILVITASVLTGIRWTSAQILLQKEECGLSFPLDAMFHLQPIMILTLTPLAVIVDGTAMSTSLKVLRYLQFVDFLKSAGMILFAALVAFCLEWSEFLVVRHTSGLALAISGVVKEVLTLSIAIPLLDEGSLSTVNVIGMVLCLSGVVLHVIIKVLRQTKAHRMTSKSEDGQPLVRPLEKPFQNVDSESEEEIIYSSQQ